MSTQQILSRFRCLKRKLSTLETEFDAFVRRNHGNEQVRQQKAKESNAIYFAIKAEMQALREAFAIAKGNE